MQLNSATQQRILAKLIQVSSASFNELWAKQGDSNKFAYHLRKLVEHGLVQKKSNRYLLTKLGKSLAAFLDSSTGKSLHMPTVAYVCIIKKGRRYVCHERTKEPFRGYWSFVSGAITFGEFIDKQALSDASKQTGLTLSKLTHKGIEEIHTYEDDELLYHHLLFIFEARATTGKLRQAITGKKQFLLTKKEFLAKQLFPPIALHELLDTKNRFVYASGERYMHDGTFTGAKVCRKLIL